MLKRFEFFFLFLKMGPMPRFCQLSVLTSDPNLPTAGSLNSGDAAPQRETASECQNDVFVRALPFVALSFCRRSSSCLVKHPPEAKLTHTTKLSFRIISVVRSAFLLTSALRHISNKVVAPMHGGNIPASLSSFTSSSGILYPFHPHNSGSQSLFCRCVHTCGSRCSGMWFLCCVPDRLRSCT